MMKEIIYFDNAATTKPIQEISDAYFKYSTNGWYNPSALYKGSSSVYSTMENTRKKVFSALGVFDGQVIFTSGGTESNNIAILNGVNAKNKCHFITSAFEHDAVYHVFKSLESKHDVTYIKPNKDGVIDSNDIIENIRENTTLVSIMHVNNETGALNDINTIANMIKAKNPAILFHSDGVQAFLKIKMALSDSIDFYSISAHKVGGLKGIGGLYINKRINAKPIVWGGGQENGLRSGTENTFGINSLALAIEHYNKDITKVIDLRKRLICGLCDINKVKINSPTKENLFSPYIVNASIVGVNGETLLHALEEKSIYIGIGSACSSKKRKNRIHEAISLTKDQSESTIRISFNHDNTLKQVDLLAAEITDCIQDLRIFRKR